jgi:hypothetical protein
MKHNQHTAPRHYLRAFRIPDDPAFIWEYQRAKPYQPGPRGDRHNPVKRALKKASVELDYYGPYEDDLEQRETAAQPIIDALRTSQQQGPQLTHQDKAQLTDYIGLLIKRTTAREERLPGIWTNVLKKELPKLRAWQQELADSGRFTEARKLQTLMDEYEKGVPDDIRQASTLIPYERVHTRINELPWTFLDTPTPILITSDNHVRWTEPEGIGSPLALLWLPLTPQRGLLACTPLAAQTLGLPQAAEDTSNANVSQDQAEQLVHLTITGAHNYLYSHTAREELAKSFG